MSLFPGAVFMATNLHWTLPAHLEPLCHRSAAEPNGEEGFYVKLGLGECCLQTTVAGCILASSIHCEVDTSALFKETTSSQSTSSIQPHLALPGVSPPTSAWLTALNMQWCLQQIFVLPVHWVVARPKQVASPRVANVRSHEAPVTVEHWRKTFRVLAFNDLSGFGELSVIPSANSHVQGIQSKTPAAGKVPDPSSARKMLCFL